MAQHNDFGKEGEALALEFLRKNDFEVLHCNWRYSRYEIDIIAKKQGLLHIMEVYKTWYEEGLEPTVKNFLYHEDQQLSAEVVSLLDFLYELSDNWKEHFEVNPG